MTSDNVLWRGKRVVWCHKPKDGHGHVMHIPVTVVWSGGSVAVIRLDDGQKVSVDTASIIQPDVMTHVVPTLEAP